MKKKEAFSKWGKAVPARGMGQWNCRLSPYFFFYSWQDWVYLQIKRSETTADFLLQEWEWSLSQAQYARAIVNLKWFTTKELSLTSKFPINRLLIWTKRPEDKEGRNVQLKQLLCFPLL